MQHVNQNPATTSNRPGLIFLSLIAVMMLASMGYATPVAAGTCPVDVQTFPAGGQTLTANVVAIDQAIMFNRLGAQNVNWMVYALERDVVTANHPDILVGGIPTPNPLNGIPLTKGGAAMPGFVALRPDKRPRPLVLRVAAGDCLQVNLTNLLTPAANPFKDELVNPNNCPGNTQACRDILQIDNQVAGRYVSFHPLGMQLVDDIDDDGSFVGKNNLAGGEGVTRDGGSLLASGESGTYTYYAEAENAYMVYSRGQPFGGEASGGNVGVGLFGVVNVEPKGAKFYRSQVTEEEMRLATVGTLPTPAGGGASWGGQPLVDYEATYPMAAPWDAEGKDGLPILNMVTATGEIVHTDINAIITGGSTDGSFDPSTYPLEGVGLRNPVLPNRLEAFREFTVVFHDETGATQAFPKWFDDPVLGHTLHGVRDSFMINYGSGGIGAEIVANRLGVGPMYDCLNCAPGWNSVTRL